MKKKFYMHIQDNFYVHNINSNLEPLDIVMFSLKLQAHYHYMQYT